MRSETLERAPDALPKEKPPGLTEYQCRTAIRDLIEEHGEMKATFIISLFLEQEKTRLSR